MGRTLDALRAAELRRAEMLAGARGSRRFRLITVASNKGGVGKTTFAIHLAVYLRALHEDLPILALALDDQTLIERTFAVVAADAPTIVDAFRAGSLKGWCVSASTASTTCRPRPTPRRCARCSRPLPSLDQLLRRSGVEGVVIVDTKSELGPSTRAAVAAADLVIAPARDLASLAEAEKVCELLPGGARDRFYVLLSGVDLRIKFENGEAKDLLALLLAQLRHRRLSHFPTFLSRSPLVEALATAPAGPPRTVLHAGPRSLVHRQMSALVPEVMHALEQAAPFDDAADATPSRRRNASATSPAGCCSLATRAEGQGVGPMPFGGLGSLELRLLRAYRAQALREVAEALEVLGLDVEEVRALQLHEPARDALRVLLTPLEAGRFEQAAERLGGVREQEARVLRLEALLREVHRQEALLDRAEVAPERDEQLQQVEVRVVGRIRGRRRLGEIVLANARHQPLHAERLSRSIRPRLRWIRLQLDREAQELVRVELHVAHRPAGEAEAKAHARQAGVGQEDLLLMGSEKAPELQLGAVRLKR